MLPDSGAQVVFVKLLPAFADAAVHEVTSVGPVVSVGQLVTVQPLPALAGMGVHELVSVGPVATVLQVVVV